METIWILIILAVIFGYFYVAKENLQIQGSLDIRGEPITAPRCGEGWVGPWNIGTSCPIVRRRMILEP